MLERTHHDNPDQLLARLELNVQVWEQARELVLDEEGFGMGCGVEGQESLATAFEFWVFEEFEEFDDAGGEDSV